MKQKIQNKLVVIVGLFLTFTVSFLEAEQPFTLEKAVENLKRFENHSLATGKTTVVYMSPDGDIGYGVTKHEVEDAVREGILPKGSNLPKSMTKKKADWWMENVTIPTYRKIVRKVVKVPLKPHQEMALVFFAQNTGIGNLKKLVDQEGRLNDGNYGSVVHIMPLYYQKQELTSRCQFQLKVFKGEPFNQKT